MAALAVLAGEYGPLWIGAPDEYGAVRLTLRHECD
jgi:hypothetical protein